MTLHDFLKQKGATNSVFPVHMSEKELLALYAKPNGIAEKMQQYGIKVASTLNQTQGCLKGVRTALEGAGAIPTDFIGPEITEAWQTIDLFKKSKDFMEIDCDIQALDKLPAGAIVVWDRGPQRGTGDSGKPIYDAEFGHISISKGDGFEMSDHICYQNVDGTRPLRDEVYGKPHVFLHKDGFVYDPELYAILEKENPERLSNATMLTAALSGNITAMRRIVELAYVDTDKLFEYDSNLEHETNADKKTKKQQHEAKHREYKKEKELYKSLVMALMQADAPEKPKANWSAQEAFVAIGQLLDSGNITPETIGNVVQYMTKDDQNHLKKLYAEMNPENGIRAYVGKDGQVYMYKTNGEGDKITTEFAHNSRANKKLGLAAAIVQLLNRIQEDSRKPKEEKDKNLPHEMISIISMHNPYMFCGLIDVYNRSLKMDTHTEEKTRKKFEDEINAQKQMYDMLQRAYALQKKFSRAITQVTMKVKKALNKVKASFKKGAQKTTRQEPANKALGPVYLTVPDKQNS